MGRDARAGYERNWTEEAVVPRYIEMIQEVAARRAPAAAGRMEGAA
jgi:hypothetical protein